MVRVGVEFTVKTDESIKGLEGWKGRTFKLEGNGFFTRENADMAEIRKAYQAVQSTPKGSYYVFVLGHADASSEDKATQTKGAQGDMPRGQQFGYVFGDGVENWGWLLAHELGHGVFTLQHLEDGNYGAKGTLRSIANLMNYTRSTELQAFQWNIMSNPAILTALDSDDASKAGVPRPAPKIKPLPAPVLFARSAVRLGKDKNGNLKEDLQQKPLTEEQKRFIGQSLLSLSDDQLFAKLRSLAEWTAGGDGEKNTLQLVEYFRVNKLDANVAPVFFSTKYMDKELNDTRVVDNFFTEGKGVLPLFNSNYTSKRGLDVFPMKDGSIESDRPIFEEWLKFFRGMWFAVHDISSFEVFITGFEHNADNTYNVEFKLVVYDHFGLDYADITDLTWLAKPFFNDNFKAWYILQHDRGYKPFITKLECTRTYYNQKTNVE